MLKLNLKKDREFQEDKNFKLKYRKDGKPKIKIIRIVEKIFTEGSKLYRYTYYFDTKKEALSYQNQQEKKYKKKGYYVTKGLDIGF